MNRKKQAILTLTLAFLTLAPAANAQKKRMLLYNEYGRGIVLMKNGAEIQAELNYDTANKNMMYLQGGDEMILVNAHEVDTVYIGDGKFIPLNERFMEVVELANGKGFIDWALRLQHRGNRGAYGQITQNKVETINTAYWTHRKYKPETAEVLEMRNNNEYGFFRDGVPLQFKNEKELVRHFPNHGDAIRGFIKEKRVDFKKVNDVLEVLNYCLQQGFVHERSHGHDWPEVREAGPTASPAEASTDERVRELLGKMTTEEKIGQLCCPTGWEMYTKTDDGNVVPSQLFKERMKTMPVGGFWATLRADPWTRKTLLTGLTPELAANALNQLQKHAVENTRLGIPLFFAEECMHGHMAIGTTVFPTGLAQGSSWNPGLIQEMAEAIALEGRLQGAHIGYGPILDLAREPRWSRVEETFGEDPVLTAKIGAAFIRGLQGDDTGDGRHLYATPKHFAAYGVPLGGHNGQNATIGSRDLFSNHLEPFRVAVETGAKTLMTSYNAIDGIPATAHRFLLKDVLRDEWGFNGFVFSDLGSIEGIAGTHRVAPSVKYAAARANQAGVDCDLGGNAYGRNLVQALEEGLVTMDDIDAAVSNILRLKFEMGLFENPYVDPKEAARLVRSENHRQIAREVAQQGIVLLKNGDNLLPLSKEMGSIAVIGPNADNIYNQLGDYTAPQEADNVTTVLDGIRQAVGPNTVVRYAKGCAIRDTTQSQIREAVEAARLSDAIVLVVGGSSARDFRTEYIETGAATVGGDQEELLPDMESGEGYDRSTLSLMGDQEKLLNALADTGKPLIVIYIQGRPLNMNNASEKADALLTAWYPGQEGGAAIADILFGDYNPAGRLPISIPRSVGQLPLYYSLGRQSNYVEETSAPLYAFGYGLSYTHFGYDNLSIELGPGQVKIACTVTNSGDKDGEEVVQLYLRDNVSSVVTPPIQLKEFKRVEIKKGESERVEFTLPVNSLSLYDEAMQRVVEPGEFTVMIGAASNDIRLQDTFWIPE